MTASKMVNMLYGRQGLTLSVPAHTTVLESEAIPTLPDPEDAIRRALETPIANPPVAELLKQKRPATVAITISDITRPVPNQVMVSALLEVINAAGIGDQHVFIIIGTGMHRPSTPAEREEMLGKSLLRRCEVIDHRADDASGLTRVSESPPVSVNRRFVEAEFRIVTGLIEPHFMAGYSGGRKGVCPALADAATVQRFHSYPTMAHAGSTNGVLEGNPCHAESLRVAKLVGVDFLANVAIDRQRRPAAFFCGDMEKAHLAGAAQVGKWTGVKVDEPFDLIITNGGGYPLDQTFYQTVKGMVTPLPAMHEQTTVLIVSHCGEGVGSDQYNQTMMSWGSDWHGFLEHIASNDQVVKDQWQYQMHTRTLAKIGVDRLRFVTDGLSADLQPRLAVNPILGGSASEQRCQQFIDRFNADQPTARIAAIPEGPYTLVQ